VPELARALGAKPPRHVPAGIARRVRGEVGVSLMTRVRGISNAKAVRELGWQSGARSPMPWRTAADARR